MRRYEVDGPVSVPAHGDELWLCTAGSAGPMRPGTVVLVTRGDTLDVAGRATPASLQDAIVTWSRAQGSLGALTVYLVGTGSPAGLVCGNGEVVTPALVKAWLDATGAVQWPRAAG